MYLCHCALFFFLLIFFFSGFILVFSICFWLETGDWIQVVSGKFESAFCDFFDFGQFRLFRLGYICHFADYKFPGEIDTFNEFDEFNDLLKISQRSYIFTATSADH